MLIALTITIIIIAIRIRRNKNLKRFEWILGKWECVEADETLTEFWKRNKKAHYECIRNSSKKTLIAESYYLMEEKGSLILVPMIYSQDQVQPFSFKEEVLSDEKAEFVNNELDFPKKISYTMLIDNEMQMEMSGMLSGKNYAESHIFTRKPVEEPEVKKTNIFSKICRKVRKTLSKS